MRPMRARVDAWKRDGAPNEKSLAAFGLALCDATSEEATDVRYHDPSVCGFSSAHISTDPKVHTTAEERLATPPSEEATGLRAARDVLLRVMQDEGIVGRKRQRIEDAADGMVRARLTASDGGRE